MTWDQYELDVTIRRLGDSDAAALYEAVEESKSEIGQWMDWCRSDYSLEDAREWIESSQKAFEDRTRYGFGIFESQNRYLGQVGLSHIHDQAKNASLGYWVRSSATGHGVAPAAVKLLAEWAFCDTDLQRLEIVVAVENVRSQRVAEKVGATREGVLKSKLRVFDRYFDAVMYSIVRGEGW